VDDADAALLAAVQGGSEQAFNRLVDRHQQAVRAFLRGLVSTADADDVAQETFLVAWWHAHTYRGSASVRSWLFAIAWRKAKDNHRRSFRRRRRDTQYQRDESADRHVDVSMEERLAVRQALTSLSLEQRAAVLLCLAGGFSHAEAAEALGFPLGTVKSHVSRGRERLREALERER
jgi:RNA polymerase sigma-70 factor (ECF subfamily)